MFKLNPSVKRLALILAAVLAAGCVQESHDPDRLDIKPDSFLNIPAEGGVFVIEVRSNIQWTVSYYPSWCTLEPETHKGDAEITVTVKPHTNNTRKAREGMIIVVGGDFRHEIVLSQEPFEEETDLYPLMHRSLVTALKAMQPPPDANGDGKLTQSEALQVTELTFDGGDITSFGGIEFFANLERLVIRNSRAETIDLTGNTALLDAEIKYNHSLTSLDVSGCALLKSLDFSYTSASALGIAGTDNLETLTCFATRLTSADLSGKTSLRDVDLGNSLYLESVNVGGCRNLTNLTVSDSKIAGLDVSGLAALSVLRCPGNSDLSSIKFGGNSSLKTVVCERCALTSLDAAAIPAVETLACGNNPALGSLNVGNCGKLSSLDCSATAIATLGVAANAKLADLNISYTAISAMDLSTNSDLHTLNCSGTDIANLDIGSNAALVSLACSHMDNLISADISANTLLTSADFSECHDLEKIFVWWDPATTGSPITNFTYPDWVLLIQKP